MDGGRRILVVDDDAGGRETIAALLARDGYLLDFAHDGRRALDVLGNAPTSFDLVLCDLIMPQLDGLDVCRAMKSHADLRLVPTILVTGLDESDDMVRGIEAGADDFITKPINKHVLRAKVRAHLRVRGQYLELRDAATDLDAIVNKRREEIAAAAKLSVREREVLELLLLGRSHEDVAQALGISARTSKFHQQNVLKKLGAESRADLMRLFL